MAVSSGLEFAYTTGRAKQVVEKKWMFKFEILPLYMLKLE
jgi:hypothetical protein